MYFVAQNVEKKQKKQWNSHLLKSPELSVIWQHTIAVFHTVWAWVRVRVLWD